MSVAVVVRSITWQSARHSSAGLLTQEPSSWPVRDCALSACSVAIISGTVHMPDRVEETDVSCGITSSCMEVNGWFEDGHRIRSH